MATKSNKPKGVVYSEPDNYIPKDVYDSVFGKKKSTTKKSTTRKPTTGKKKK